VLPAGEPTAKELEALLAEEVGSSQAYKPVTGGFGLDVPPWNASSKRHHIELERP